MKSLYKPHLTEIQSSSTSQNPEAIEKIKKQASLHLLKRSHLNPRMMNPQSNHNICFISPKKIAYFEKIDQSCLGASEIKIIQQQSNRNNHNVLKLELNQKSMQIDYESIKKCLSPRIHHTKANENPKNIEKVKCPKLNKYIAKEQAELNDIQFYRKLVNDLKQQVLQMSSIIQAKDQQIRQKDARINQLQKQAFREQVSDIQSQTMKQLSTNFEERSSRLIQSFIYLHEDDKNDKIAEMDEIISIYKSTIKKQQIQIDMLRKNHFDRVKMQTDLHAITKKHISLKKKVEKLVQKNIKLNKQVQKTKYQMNNYSQNIFLLQYSPQKPYKLS